MNYQAVRNLKDACQGAIAKCDRETETYLPLYMHMVDTGGIMEKLFEHRVSEQVLCLFAEEGVSRELLKRLFCLAGLLHDIGKETCIFQSMLLEKVPEYRQFKGITLNYKSFGESDSLHHAESGMMILISIGYPEGFASLVGAHHGRSQKSLTNKEEAETAMNNKFRTLYGSVSAKPFWQTAWKGISAACLEISGITLDEIPSLSQNCWMVLAGILVEADWISSNMDCFPLLAVTDQLCSESYPQRIETGWKRIGLTEVWRRDGTEMTEKMFQGMFGFWPNEVQSELIRITEKVKDPGLLIVEAQMGVGKTEAALAAADIFSARKGSGGLYFGLPTQATSNGLFPRFKDWAAKESGSAVHSMKLAHGMATFNEAYQSIPHGRSNLDEDGRSSSLIVHDWMQGRKQGMLSDFVIGTVDQGLMMALDHRHVMLRHAGLAGKTVIIDEVHAYDAYMNEYLERMLEWLGSYHAPVILLSATLPASKKTQLILAYQKGRFGRKYKSSTESEWTRLHGYPSFTWTDGKEVNARVLNLAGPASNVEVVKEQVSGDEEEERVILQILEESLNQGGCAGIVVNTVRKAQELTHFLSKRLPDWKIVLFHSRFTSLRRSEIEQKVLSLSGKGSKESRQKVRERLVIIGTQVLEQSLDVDFDLMITELAPMDLLLQRIGRLHRHKDRIRPANLKDPFCHVLIPPLEEANHSISPVYEDWLQYQTARLLPNEIEIPNDIPALVNDVYSEPDVHDLSEYERHMVQQMQKKTRTQENKADAHVLESPNKRLRVDHGLNGLIQSRERNTEEKSLAAVRDIETTISCILLRQLSDHLYKMADATEVSHILDAQRPLTFDEIRLLLTESVNLPPSVPFISASVQLEQDTESRFGVWMQNPLLKNRLILVLDAEGKATVAGRRLRYSEDYGLEDTKE